MADEGEELRWRQRRESLEEEEEEEAPMKQIESARSKWRKQADASLEESWSSLNLFDRSHRGRISTDMEGIPTRLMHLFGKAPS